MTLRVAESSSSGASGAGAQDKEEYFRALKRKAELARRVDKWMDKLMEETVDRGQFQRAVSLGFSYLVAPQRFLPAYPTHCWWLRRVGTFRASPTQHASQAWTL